ncbi:MAG: ArsA family ATPase [Gemmatimonadota bacterium]|nr:ArsA family ATPase [Gemmatimonadota bacterium]
MTTRPRSDRPLSEPGIDRLLASLPRWILVGGKGGVGKTTCAAALAARSARRGRTLLLSTDPACSLADAIGTAIGGEPTQVPGHDGLFAMQLDPIAARDAFLARWRDVLVEIVDRGTYLDRDDAAALIDAALPGADETMALLAMPGIDAGGNWERVVLDTAPTGHTLRLLELPAAFEALVRLLDSMQEKHRFMVRALTHRYRTDDADRFLSEVRSDVDRVTGLLRDGERLAAVLVTRPEDVVIAETARYATALDALGVSLRAIVINAARRDADEAALRAIAPSVERWTVPLLLDAPMGIDAIEQWGLSLASRGKRRRAAVPARGASRAQGSSRDARRALRRPLLIVAGKGGVGKTTVACALAIDAAAEGSTLIVSTDPAPSLGDALDQVIGESERAVAGVPGLTARELDASEAFRRFRESYGERVDALFDSLLGGADAAADRRIVHDLMALAPPGIDEVYALATLGETLAEGRFASLIVDPAPTGHLLRLLDMPEIAMDWTHRLLRLILKYKDVVQLGETGSELLGFAKRTRGLRELLADPTRAGIVIVSLDEPLVRGETLRLSAALAARGLATTGLIWNRATDAARASEGGQWMAPALEPPPRAAARLREWADSWTRIDG